MQKLRATYAAVECTAKQLTNCQKYRQNTQRTRKRNQKYDGSGSLLDEATTAACTFRVSAFTVIIDSLFAALQKRSRAYEGISARFGFLRNVRSMSWGNYPYSQQHWLNGFLMAWRPACPANLCNSRRCWTPTSDGKLRELPLSQMLHVTTSM